MMMPGFLLQGKAPDSKVPEKSRPPPVGKTAGCRFPFGQ